MIEPANPHILKSTPFVKAYFVIHSEFASCIGTFFDFIRKGFFLKWSLEFALEYPPGILPGIIGKFRHSALNLPILWEKKGPNSREFPGICWIFCRNLFPAKSKSSGKWKLRVFGMYADV